MHVTAVGGLRAELLSPFRVRVAQAARQNEGHDTSMNRNTGPRATENPISRMFLSQPQYFDLLRSQSEPADSQRGCTSQSAGWDGRNYFYYWLASERAN